MDTLAATEPTDRLPGVGPARAAMLARAGYRLVGDLVRHLPTGYEDRRRLSPLGALDSEAESVTVEGRLRGLRRIFTRRRRLTLVRATLEGDGAKLAVLWFNRPYLLKQVSEGEHYRLHGRLRRGAAGAELLNPSIDPGGEGPGDALVPVYPRIERLGTEAVRRLIGAALERLGPLAKIEDRLPAELLELRALPSLGVALEQLHRPAPGCDAAPLLARTSAAHQRLIYGELLELQVRLLHGRRQRSQESKPHSYRIDDQVRAAARSVLPFRLTGAQKRVLREITDDLSAPQPMLRLLQGDVGCGKTIVAALALVVALESGLQAAFMAPTELLAEQHYAALRGLFGERYRMGLITGSAPQQGGLRAALASGELQLAIGTHALVSEETRFRALGLAIVDEQHRFGVGQREVLRGKGGEADLLVMTATPIPRSLALTAYGDLDLSVIDELPPGRRPVVTELVARRERRRVYAELRRELALGAQAFVVVPLIEGSEAVRAAALDTLGERVRGYLCDYPSAFLHGRIEREERERIMAAFGRGELRVLVATTVVEVGVDVPGATLMIIESAERFGLAQLHQLRGRVGRGTAPARCIAVHGPLSLAGRRRLAAFAATTDGFAIAEQDLEIRGPGDLLGTRQAGLPSLRLAHLARDRGWLQAARADAERILEAPQREDYCRYLKSVLTSESSSASLA